MSLSPKKYFSVTKKEWNGLVVLMILIALVLVAPYVYQSFHKNETIDVKDFNAAVARLKGTGLVDSNTTANATPFRFNPNNLPPQQWAKLGLTEQQIGTIKNYEAKGGHFNSKADLKKMYSISAEDYKRLAPYIDLPEKAGYVEKTNAVVEINSADTLKLMQIRGIGSGYARLIIRYRDRLGGFYKKEQLKEVAGLDSLTYQDIIPFIKVDEAKIIKIDLNKATQNSLAVFPYLSYKQRNAIVEYRNQHGDYKELADLKNIPIIDDVLLRKIEPYISLK
ncbi:helix-hairpin-helix domain-containing protein [Mucilaginibacter mali]|uniref:Helix-hairpin-helix domain-containing protein n=1 Tax=Mucilaginibacter mali TaxID=2740462 RepID=A0A7D4UP34_9SPHI|nr:helix-hairpin-helix domain-containing protein [Mucilaginibacter mali]QKJ32581.1 helix-hairpin-helix domain-containing protein [Mucilaginibacter mali]